MQAAKPMKVTGFIYQWLTKRDRSVAWLVRRAGVDASHLYMILAERKKPGPRVLAKLERAMELEPGYLQKMVNSKKGAKGGA